MTTTLGRPMETNGSSTDATPENTDATATNARETIRGSRARDFSRATMLVHHVHQVHPAAAQTRTPVGGSSTGGTHRAASPSSSGPAASAQLDNPLGLAVDCVDALYVADHVDNRVAKVASVKKRLRRSPDALAELPAALGRGRDAVVVTSGGILAALCGALLSLLYEGVVAFNR
ncbi:hypothetical protein ACIHAR_28910 [Streptomyces sp. NPDC052016]|uniref:hypothetical protein n=1 Tax=Streptomyces sp. NPDC052016 TaxID=3365680 RepID=UPI0037D20957